MVTTGSRRARTGPALLVVALVGSLTLVPGRASAEPRVVRLATPGTTQPPTYDGSAGSALFFSTVEPLVSSDTDTTVDVYRSDNDVLTLMTPQTTMDVTFDAASADGAVVIGTTNEPLAGGDIGNNPDIYRFTTGGPTYMSPGTDNAARTFEAASTDGSTVVFETTGKESPDDSDNAVDVYWTHYNGAGPGTSNLATLGPGPVHYAGAPPDLRFLYVTTDDALRPEDHNAAADVYGVDATSPFPGQSPALISNGTGGPDQFAGTGATGFPAYWSTADAASTGDTDGAVDLYRWAGAAQSKLISGGTTSAPVTLDAVSDDGLVAYFSTVDSLVGADTDTSLDVYKFDSHDLAVDTDDTLDLMTGGTATTFDATFRDAAPDGSSVVFDTRQPLPGSGDTGTSLDVYRSTGAADSDKTLLSGIGSADAHWQGASSSGARQFFTTTDALTPNDVDAATDVYVDEGGALTDVSAGSAGFPATYGGNSADGAEAWFVTAERLVAADTDAAEDIYESKPGTDPPPSPPPDRTPPAATATAKKQKIDGSIEVTLSCGSAEPCRATPSGVLAVPKVSAGARGAQKFTLAGPSVAVAAGARATLRLKVPKQARKAAAAALKAGQKLKAKVTIIVTDTAGNARTLKVAVPLKR